MSSKILVTGGAGYIGSHVVNLLGKAGHDLVILDNLSTGRKSSILYGELVEMDLAETDKLRQLIGDHKFEGAIHFAGSIIVPESVTDPLKYYKNNTENSLNLIKACSELGVNRFIFSSTAAVYGLPDGGICEETTPVGPINPYGRSKLMTEWMLEDTAFAVEAFNYIALRYFNVAGANVDGLVGQCSPFSTHLIKIASETALGKRPSMNVYGDDYDTKDGTCIRDYIHVDDLAQAHLDAFDYLLENKKSHILNCGYGEGYSVKEVIEMVKKVSGVDFKTEITSRRDGDAPWLVAKSDKIRSVLNWKPQYNDLELIVKTALDWESKL